MPLAAPQRVRIPAGRPPWRAASVWRIVHVGQSAAILASLPADPAGRLLPLTSTRRGLVPAGVCLPDERAFETLAARLAAVRTGAASGAPAAVDLADWRTVPPAEVSVVNLRIRPVAARARAVEEFAARLRAEDQDVEGGAAMDPRPARSLAEPLMHAALDGDGPRVAHVLSRLVGAGPGATPSGDDVIVGVLAGLDAVAGSLLPQHRARAARALIGARLRALLDRTTAVSRHDLAAATVGEFAEHVHLLVSALTDVAAVPAAVAAARGWGATSGVDLASGMARSLMTACHPDLPTSPTQLRRSA
jgi:hypothetical protein